MRPMPLPPRPRVFSTVLGVDFSGARLAGRNAWIAAVEPHGKTWHLTELASLESCCGSAEREIALNYLADRITSSRDALWGLDFPFGLPVELLETGVDWPGQLRWVESFIGDAKAFGHECVRRAKALGGRLHIRRQTDVQVKTPFDCYHYRIIYQTFHGMRDVLRPVARSGASAILPFQYDMLASAGSVVVEACPSSTLKRWGARHQNYKQPAGGALLPKRRRTRHEILAHINKRLVLSAAQRRAIMRNGGGDALDAVIAAIGTIEAWQGADHVAIAASGRIVREGFVYA